MKRFVALIAPALIALCFVGFAAAAHSLAAPSGGDDVQHRGRRPRQLGPERLPPSTGWRG